MQPVQEGIRGGWVALAPVASITNSIYRRICKRFGADYCVTELVSSEGLTRETLRSYELAQFTEAERPLAVQIFGGDPEKMALAAELVNEMRPDAIDINMGCPARKVVRRAGGSSLLRDLPRLAEVVRSVVRVARTPVSVKIRAGWDDSSINAVEVARIIEAEGAAWITVHPRTRKQGFGGRARWEIIRAVQESVRIPVIGNGDILRPADALAMFRDTGCDSVMIGRGSFGYPWIFQQVKELRAGREPRRPSARERVALALENLRMEIDEATLPAPLVVTRMRKHLAWYITGLPGSKELRPEMFKATTYDEVAETLEKFVDLEEAARAGRGAAAADDRALEFAGMSCDPASLEVPAAAGAADACA